MYTTPASGSSQNPNDLEDYLLGKKRVDKILTADDNAKVRLTPFYFSPYINVFVLLAWSSPQEFYRSSERQQST